MRGVRQIMRIVELQMRRLPIQAKSIVVLMLIPLIVWSTLQPVLNFARNVGYNISIMGIVFVFDDIYGSAISLLFSLGAIVLFADAPFYDEQQQQCLLRCKSVFWIGAQLAYIFFLSLMYVLYWIIWVAIIISPNADWRLEWGVVWNTLARTSADYQYGIALDCQFGLIRQYTPQQAFMLSCILKAAYCCLIGNVCFVGNMFSYNGLGTYISGALALQDFLAINEMGFSYIWLSPSSMSRLSSLDPSRSFLQPAPGQAIALLCGIIFMLGLRALLFGKKQLKGACL